MYILDFSHNSIHYISLSKTILGKLKITSAGKIEYQAQDWEQKLTEIIRGQKIAISIPQTKCSAQKFHIPSGMNKKKQTQAIEEKVRESCDTDLENISYDYVIHKKVKNHPLEVAIIAASHENLKPFLKIIQNADAKTEVTVPQPIAAFRMFQDGIVEDEIVMFAQLEAEDAVINFFDKRGPIASFEKERTKDYTTPIAESIEQFKSKTNNNITRLVIGGDPNTKIDRKELKENTKLLNIQAEDVIKDRLSKLKITNEVTADLSPFVNAIGLGILSFEKKSLNLTKKDDLMRLEAQIMKEKTKDDKKTAKKKEEAHKDEKDKTEEKDEKTSTRPTLTTEPVEDTKEEKEEPVSPVDDKTEDAVPPPPIPPASPTTSQPAASPVNTTPLGSTPPPQTPPPTTSSPSSTQFHTASFGALDDEKPASGKKKKLILFVIVLVLLLLAAGAVFYFQGAQDTTPQNNQATTQQPTPQPTPTTAPQLERSDLSVQVLNGSGTPGKAGEVAEYLEGLGYENIDTGNADSYDYDETVVQLKEDAADYEDLVIADLESEYPVQSNVETLDEDSEYDLIIIIGQSETSDDEDLEDEEAEDPTPTEEAEE